MATSSSYGTCAGSDAKDKSIIVEENYRPLNKKTPTGCWRMNLRKWDRGLYGWLIVLSFASAIMLIPKPDPIPMKGWGLLSIFLATILGAVVRPGGFGLGPLCVITVAVATGTRCLTINSALKDLGTKNLWLVVMAFFISRALLKSRLSYRIARGLASFAGEGQPLLLSYCFVLAEFILAPMIPSVTARTGSVIFPIVIGISMQRDPDGSRKVASFLTLTSFQASAITSSMFVTAMAGNPVVQEFANAEFQNIGFIDEINPLNWAIGASLPGLICLALTPALIYSLHTPLNKDPWLLKWASEQARAGRRLDGKAVERICQEAGADRMKTLLFKKTLTQLIQTNGDVEGRARASARRLLGEEHIVKVKVAKETSEPWSYAEVMTLLTVMFMLAGWILDGKVGSFRMDPTTTAFAGVSVLIVSGVLTWDDIISEKSAWNTLFWLAVLSALANALKNEGVVNYFSDQIGVAFAQGGIESTRGFSILLSIYVYSHYFFASCSAHMLSMYSAFLQVGVGMKVAPLGAGLLLGYASNIMGGLTHYATGAAPVLFGKGFVKLLEWWRIGFVVTTANLLIYLFFGGAWMKFVGYL
eukprot:CAMPEP_0167759944 /NCGR_PEP_ID=MMETSP0110_2-20121227/11307_1 /TAXON_ID=629695 /ORGANISM="Gymnochlora sp., Strain CCMP2014" /LENGTH=586 /DNA_ID=CAMNT_0007646391 /DNA_START=113 /DNA_END=1873 /DNA_ORIENTATION=+